MFSRYSVRSFFLLLCVAATSLCAAERSFEWCGLTWLVKEGQGRGPGPNAWLASEDSVWLDDKQQLHLKIRNINDLWHCAEIRTAQATAYGRYQIELASPIDRIDPQVVFGFFAYADDQHEVDLEISSWGERGMPKRQFVVQPYHKDGHLQRSALLGPGPGIAYELNWLRSSISASARLGTKTDTWQFTGTVPKADKAHLHLNLWLFRGKAPQCQKEQEVIIKSVKFIPENRVTKP